MAYFKPKKGGTPPEEQLKTGLTPPKEQPKTGYIHWARNRVKEILPEQNWTVRSGVLRHILNNKRRVRGDEEEWRCLLGAFDFDREKVQKLRAEIAARNAHLKDEDALEAQIEHELGVIDETTQIRLRPDEIKQLVAVAISRLDELGHS